MTRHLSTPFTRKATALSAWTIVIIVMVSCVACTGPDPVETPSPTGIPSLLVECRDGRQGQAPHDKGKGALGVTFTGGRSALPRPLPRAADIGVKTSRLDSALFWKAPLAVTTPADIVLTIEPPHYLAYVPPVIWTNSPNGVNIDPWMTRQLQISPCDDGASQSYLGGLLIDPTQECIIIEIESTRNGRTQRSELRFDTANQGC